jgi:uncharacterized protein YcfJ
MRNLRESAFLACVALAASGMAQATPTENTSYGYANVLRVEPVYERRIVQTIDPACLEPNRNTAVPGPPLDCKPRSVAVRKVVAYDVEYNYKGDTYMSRLDFDPGSKLRVRVSVTPDDRRAPPSVAPSETH